jgi:predicted CoA-binding protein
MDLAIQQKIEHIICQAQTIAVVGLSPKPHRPSHQVARYLLTAGFTVIPVNPGQSEILGCTCYPNLTEIPGPIDIVNIFRRSEHVVSIVRDAITIRAKVIWMQEGIINREAAAVAEGAGLVVVMDRCLKTDHLQIAGRSQL